MSRTLGWNIHMAIICGWSWQISQHPGRRPEEVCTTYPEKEIFAVTIDIQGCIILHFSVLSEDGIQ